MERMSRNKFLAAIPFNLCEKKSKLWMETAKKGTKISHLKENISNAI